MAKTKQQVMEEIELALNPLREGIAMHSGGVQLVDFNEQTGVVSVRLQGMCVGCPMSELTLKAGIEETVCMMVPEVKEVINVADAEDQVACAHP